jgi:hypothetical protein
VRLSDRSRAFVTSMRQGMFNRRKVDDPTYRGPERRTARAGATAAANATAVKAA